MNSTAGGIFCGLSETETGFFCGLSETEPNDFLWALRDRRRWVLHLDCDHQAHGHSDRKMKKPRSLRAHKRLISASIRESTNFDSARSLRVHETLAILRRAAESSRIKTETRSSRQMMTKGVTCLLFVCFLFFSALCECRHAKPKPSK